MSFFNSISSEQKRQLLKSAHQSLTFELANTLLRSGVDPDTFDIDSYNFDSYEHLGDIAIRIGQLCDSINLVNKKLSGLE